MRIPFEPLSVLRALGIGDVCFEWYHDLVAAHCAHHQVIVVVKKKEKAEKTSMER